MLLQLQPITLICPTVPHQRETESFSSIQPNSDLRTVLLGGDLLGRRSSNWGVIEVTKRGEVNIPGIPSCCRPGRRTRLLPYLPWLRPASLSSFCSTKKCKYFIHWIDHVIVHLKICKFWGLLSYLWEACPLVATVWSSLVLTAKPPHNKLPTHVDKLLSVKEEIYIQSKLKGAQIHFLDIF